MVVVPGTSVVWTNDAAITTSVTATDGTFSSGPLAPGASFSYVFTEAIDVAYVSGSEPPARGAVRVGPPVAVGGLATPTTVVAAQAPEQPPVLAHTGATAVFISVAGFLLTAGGASLLLRDLFGRALRPDLAVVRATFRRRVDDLLPGARVGSAGPRRS